MLFRSNDDLNALALDIKARIELTKKENLNAEGEVKAEEYNDIWNKENIDQKLFISLPLKERGKFLSIYVSPNGSLVIDFVNKNTTGSEISRKQYINDPEFNTFSDLLSLLNAAIKEHDSKVKLEANKMDVVLTGRSFKAALPKSIDTLQVLDMEASVGPNVVKDVSIYIDMLEPASDVEADPVLSKVDSVDLQDTDLDINNLDLTDAPEGAVFNPDLLRGVAPVNPPVTPAPTTKTDVTDKPIQVNSADALNKVLAAQQSIPQQIKQLQTEVDTKIDEIKKTLDAKMLAEKGELTVADKKENRIQAENSPEVLAIKGQIEVLFKSMSLKAVPAGYTESDVTNLTEFLTWVQKNLQIGRAHV